MEDELQDVNLSGIRLVSDNPDEWIVPTSMNKYDSVKQWWIALMDNQLFDGTIDQNTIEKLYALIHEYDALQSEAYDGVRTVPHQARIRAVIRTITQSGMTIEQTGRLLGVTESRIIHELYCNRTLDRDDVAIRLVVENMIRDGATMQEIMSKVTMTESQIDSFASMLGLQVINEPSVNTAKPADIRETAILMKAAGHSNIYISDHIRLSHGCDILPATISQWWNRHNKRRQQ
jgi:hypothetical protein